MTLSNVFIGKKVVQQIYLNNAIIYQSKGWETLPCAPTEVWTKNYDTAGNEYIRAADIDKNDNLYVLTSIGNVYKINPDGEIMWKKYYTASFLKIDRDNNIYLVGYKKIDANNNDSIIIKIDDNGSVVEEFDITKLSDYSYLNNLESLAIDSSNFYIIYSSGGSHYFVVFSKTGKLLFKTASYNCNQVATDNGQYYYINNKEDILKCNKSNFSSELVINKSVPKYGYSGDDIPIYMLMDNMGNLIYRSYYSGMFKLDPVGKLLSKAGGMGNSSIKTNVVDYQNNVYGINKPNTSQVNLKKVSSDGTVIYDTAMIKNPTNIDYVYRGKLAVDYNGNIYYVYTDSDCILRVKKMIEVIKKG